MKPVVLNSSILTYREQADAALADASRGEPDQCLVLRPVCHFEAGLLALMSDVNSVIALFCAKCKQPVIRFAIELDSPELIQRIGVLSKSTLDAMYLAGELHLRSRVTEVEIAVPVRPEPKEASDGTR